METACVLAVLGETNSSAAISACDRWVDSSGSRRSSAAVSADAPALTVPRCRATWARTAAASPTSVPGASALTAAELRLLPLLSTHLSFAEIGAELFVSPNTAKTHAVAIYRKLDAGSRGQAVARARELGLLES